MIGKRKNVTVARKDFAVLDEAGKDVPMNILSRTISAAAVGAMAAAIGFSQTPAFAQEIDADAQQILSAMSDYLGSQKSFSVEFEADIDVLTKDGQKLKFISTGNIIAERPGRFRGTRKGTVADVEIILDGSSVTIYGRNLNGYVQFPATTIQEAVNVIRDDIGFDAPGADLLMDDPLNNDLTDTTSGEHIGMTDIAGVTVHHLAFRGEAVDWQVWIQDGDAPLPLRYVISSTWTTGAPEFSLQLSDWNTAPSIDAETFNFTPPADAQKLSSFAVDETGQLVNAGE